MGQRSLRRRLYTVLLQWFLLLVVAAGGVLAFAFSRVHQNIVDERLLFARTIAHSLDSTVSLAIQDLGRLASNLTAVTAEAAAPLRVFRFHSPFREATYLLDADARMLAADPVDAAPLPAERLREHEAVTPLVRKAGGDVRPVVAIVQPFRRGGRLYYLVSEMNPVASVVSTFLQDLDPAPETLVAVVDEHGTVIAAADRQQLFRTLPSAATYGDRIRSHRPLVLEDAPGELSFEGGVPADALTVMVPLRFAPWGVVVQQPRAQAFAGLYAAQRGLLLAGAMLTVVGLLLARALSKSIVTPIRHLSRQAAAVGGGELSAPIRVSGDHEIEVLARTLDRAREELAATLGALQTLNESLEGQVAARTRVIERRYLDLRLLLTVAQLSTQERAPERLVPEILRLVAAHYALSAVAMVARPPGATTTYVVPAEAVLPWLAPDADPPAGWTRRRIAYQDQLQAELYHPLTAQLDEEVMKALEHQLALSLHGAQLWKRTLAQDEQRQVLVRRLLGAAEEERRRLARELHDEIAQLLTVIQLSLDRVGVDSPDLRKASALLVETQKEIHRIIYDLRPSVLDHLGLAAALQGYADDHLTRQGVAVSLEIEDGLRARPEIEITTFRIYQEMVTNILRHAEAEHVSIELYARDGHLVLAVEDDGKGFDAATTIGAGITGMRERAALVGGTLSLDGEPGLGTQAVLEIPLG